MLQANDKKTLAPTSPKSSSSPRNLYSKSLSMTSNATNVPTNEYLTNLDSQMCCTALEFIITLLASQSLLILKDPNLSSREKQLICRELFPELSIFHDFVRRKILVESKDLLHRKKCGLTLMKGFSIVDDGNDDFIDEEYNSDDYVCDSPPSPPQQLQQKFKKSMRVEVVRRLHLRNLQESSNDTEMTPRKSILSQRGSPTGIITSTPALDPSMDAGPSSSKRVMFDDKINIEKRKKGYDFQYNNLEYFDEDDDPDIDYFDDTDELKNSMQSFVKLVEEDYFHLLSIVFSTLQVDD